MEIFKSHDQRKIRPLHFLAISLVAVVLGAIGGAASAQPPESDQHPRYMFADGEVAFCADQGRINEGHILYEANALGFETPSDAANNYIISFREEIRNDRHLSPSLLQLIEPARQFQVTHRKDVNEHLIYFDLPSNEPSVLEARLVVEYNREGFFVTQTFICEAQLVSDPVLFDRLYMEWVRR